MSSQIVLPVLRRLSAASTKYGARCVCSLPPSTQRSERSVLPACVSYVPERGMAGHSKWQNIKHIKAAKDAQKSENASKIIIKIKQAIRDGNNQMDPKLNFLLARVFEQGKKANVAESTMMSVIKNMQKSKENSQLIHLEAKAMGSCFLVIECYTDKVVKTKNSLQSILKKYNGTIGRENSAKHAFDFKGVIHVPKTEATTLDDMEEVAIEVEAEEVVESTDEDNAPVWQFTCDPQELHQVKDALIAKNLEVLHAKQEYIPHTFVTLNPDLITIAFKLCTQLEGVDEVVKIYDNIKAEEEVASSQAS